MHVRNVNIYNNNNNNKHNVWNQHSRLRQEFDETTHYITLACLTLAKEQYIKKHDGMWAQLHFYTWNAIGAQLDNERLYDRVPKKEVETVK